MNILKLYYIIITFYMNIIIYYFNHDGSGVSNTNAETFFMNHRFHVKLVNEWNE